jgi:prepilin-type N-terminal cleavage/methylation domain-containing protein
MLQKIAGDEIAARVVGERRQWRLHSAFTLMELLVVVALIAVLATVLTPVIVGAKHRAKQTGSGMNLKQIHIALMLYQGDWQGGGGYGDLPQMGMPPGTVLLRSRLKLPVETWQSPCGTHPDFGPAVIHYEYWLYEGGPEVEAASLAFEENLLLVSDVNCNSHDVKLGSTYMPRRGLGVLLSGQLVNHYKAGNLYRRKWWSDPVHPYTE